MVGDWRTVEHSVDRKPLAVSNCGFDLLRKGGYMNDCGHGDDHKVLKEMWGDGYCWFLAMFLAVGLFLLGIGVQVWMKGESMKTWSSMTGKVVSSTVKGYHDGGIEERIPGVNRKTSYGPDVAYEYEVGGKVFQSRKISLVSEGSRLEDAQRVVQRYPAGSKVRVYVNPRNPEEAILNTSGAAGRFYLPTGGVVALIGFVGLAKEFIRKSRSGASATER